MSPANKHLNEEKANKRKKLLILLLLLLLLISITITTCTLLKGQDQDTPVLAPDYAPQEEDKNAEEIEDDNETDKMEQAENGGAVTLSYSNEVTIDLSDKKAIVSFANPFKSNQNMMIQLVIQDTVLLQSGLLKPGKLVKELDLKDGVLDDVVLTPGGYNGMFKVYFYDNETGERAVLDTELEVKITVQE